MPRAPQETVSWYASIEPSSNFRVQFMPEIYLEKIAALLQHFMT